MALLAAVACILATLAMGCELFGFPPLDPERRPVARGRIDDLSFAADRAARTVDVAAYFSDPDGDALSFKAASSNRNVAAVRSDRSTLTVTPGVRGSATITVTASDPGGLSAVQRFQVTVGNQPPVPRDMIAALSLTVDAAGHPVELAAYFSDPDDDPLTYGAESSDENVATVRTAGSTLTITPVARGEATITVTATDPGGLRTEQRFPVTVENQAPEPRGTIPGLSLAADASARTVHVAAYFSDPEGDALTYKAESSNRNVATVRSAGSTLSITPVARGAATVSARITVTATDPGGLSAVQQFHVSVNNRAPEPRGAITVPALDADPRSVEVAAYFSDPDRDALTYAAESSDESVATVGAAGSTLTIAPVARGEARITVTATDPGGLSAEQRFAVTVNNQAPTALGSISVPLLAADARSVEVDSFFSDPEGEALDYATESSNENVATAGTAGSTLTIAPVARGEATITVTATDPEGLSAEQRFPVTVGNQAPLPQGNISGLSLAAGASARTVDVASYFSDPDGDALTYAAESSHELVATALADGSTVTVTPQSRGGTARITVTASDPGGLTAEQQFHVSVNNRPPEPQGAISVPALDVAPRSVDVAAYFTDPDRDELTYAAESSDENVATAGTAGSTVTIAPVARGAATITVTATDPGGLRAVQRFVVTVNNQAPAAQGSISAPPPLDPDAAVHTVDVAAYFSDPDGDELTYQAESSHDLVATARADGSTVTVTPRAKGSTTITVTATDQDNLSATQQFPVTVKNRPPAVQGSIPAPPPLDPDAAVHTVDVAAYFSDPDGDELTYEAESSHDLVATARADGSTVTVTPRAEGSATITVTATDQGNLSATQEFPVTVQSPGPLRLLSLTVTGGSASLYPAFAAGVQHYAVRCGSATTLRVRAQASGAAATVTLLRADASANQTATGSLDASVAVSGDHDVVIELSDGTDTTTYVLHCISDDFPDIRILKKTEAVTDGLLFMTLNHDGPLAASYWAVLDNNGVPRFHRKEPGLGFHLRDFRRHADGRYSINRYGVDLLDQQFELIKSVGVVAPLSRTDVHDFLITDAGNYLFISYRQTNRDVCEAPAEPCPREFRDSVIQEVTPGGTEVFRWNSWDHMKLTDCALDSDRGQYAHLNSLQLVEGDIIASFRYCNQVLRIDRSGGTGAIEWKLGGTAPTRDPNTAFLKITNDPAGEFCGQHHATLTDSNTVVLFDNGVLCGGPRKAIPPFSRVVEYDISSGSQAVYQREFRLPASHGHAFSEGGATVLENGHWLIAWGGHRDGVVVRQDELIVASEVDPRTGTAVFHMNVSRLFSRGWTYRVYREREADVPIPLNLP